MVSRVIVGMHQPNFFPWMGFFDKIVKSEIFVFMDTVQYPKGSWTNRVKIINQNQAKWLTCPVTNVTNNSLIKDIIIADKQHWEKKIIRTIKHNYIKCPFFDEIFEIICSMIFRDDYNLSSYNIANILEVCNLLNIGGKFILQSSLNTSNKSTDLLIEITKKVGATAYLYGGGCSEYQEDYKFRESNIEIIPQNYIHKYYKQFNLDAFVPGLSIIDVLFNCGIDGTKEIIRNYSNNFYKL